MTKTIISSNSTLEKEIGFSRAVRIDNHIAVSGTAPIRKDGSNAFEEDLYNQTKFCIKIIKDAIEEAGGILENVIRTRIMLKDISIWREAAKAHGEYFSEIQPTCTFVEVNRFINEKWLVEVEADCIIPSKL